MAKFKFKATTNVSGYFTAKLVGAVTDADVGKPFKLATGTTDTYELCADGDGIDAFLVGLETATADGLKIGTLNNQNRVRVEASGAANVGDLVEAAAPAALGTAEANKLGVVSTHAVAAVADILPVNWRIISANTTDGVVADGDTEVIIERC